MFDVYKFKSNKLGPHILILGAVHGNEIAGTLAGESIALDFEIGNLKLIKGSVTFIPLVNKKAQEQDTRFVDENLNRVIIYHPNPTTHEQKIANNLLQHIEKADVLLDLHSTHCEKDEAFAFIDYPTKQNCELLQVMPVQTALAGWPSIYEKNTKILNYSTEEYAHMKGITALTLECGYHKDKKSITLAKKAILNTLSHYGMIQNKNPILQQKRIVHLVSYIIKEKNGILLKDYNHLDHIYKGEEIAKYTSGEILKAPFDGFIIMPNHQADTGSEWYYLGKENY